MSDEDRIRRALNILAPRPSFDGVRDALVRRRRRRELWRRTGSAILAVGVVAGTVGGFLGLRQTFRAASGQVGVIAYSRTLRACPGHPNVGGPQVDPFAASPDGSTQWDLADGAGFGHGRSRSEEQIAFSPDGQRFAWIDHYQPGLFVTDITTGATDRLVSELDVDSPSWSPDGTSIAFTGSATLDQLRQTQDPDEIAALSEPAIYSVPAFGGESTMLAEQAHTAVFSPTGEMIAFIRDPRLIVTSNGGGFEIGPEPGATQSLWFMDSDGSDEREIRAQPQDPDWSVIDGVWSPDGDRFAAEVSFAGNHDIVVGRIDGLSGTRLTHSPAADTSPAWSPDGSTIAFSTGRWGTGIGHSEIATVPADGGAVTRVTNDCWDDYSPTWVTDDSAIRSLPSWPAPALPENEPAATEG